MRTVLELTVLVFLGVMVALLLLIVFGRSVRDRRGRREDAVRPLVEEAIVAYLMDEDAPVPSLPDTTTVLANLRTVAIEGLVELDGRERLRLTRLLERTGVVAYVAADLRSPRSVTRRRAAQDLAQIKSHEAAPALLQGLGDPDLDVRTACALGLAELHDARYLDAIAAVVGEAAAHRRGPASEILLALASFDHMSLQVVLAEMGSPAVRRLVVAVAGGLRLHEYAPLLRKELESDDEELAFLAARGAGLVGDLDAFDPLVALVRDERRSLKVRAEAAEALGRLGDALATDVLERLLALPAWELRAAGAQGLLQLGAAGQEALERVAAGSSEGKELAAAALAS